MCLDIYLDVLTTTALKMQFKILLNDGNQLLGFMNCNRSICACLWKSE